MVNGLGVFGWGVGGIEAEAAMLGQPLSMLIPAVVGFKLHGALAGRRDGDGPGAHRDAHAAQERRRRKVRGILRHRAFEPLAAGPRDHRQHGAGIWRDHGISSRWTTKRWRICDSRRASEEQVQAGRGVHERAGTVPHGSNARSDFLRQARTRPGQRGADHGWPEASARQRAADAGQGSRSKRRSPQQRSTSACKNNGDTVRSRGRRRW